VPPTVLGAGVRIDLIDGPTQRADTAVVERVGHGEGRKQASILQSLDDLERGTQASAVPVAGLPPAASVTIVAHAAHAFEPPEQ
jgi:hypothetical protein